jgi:hypothetical protein
MNKTTIAIDPRASGRTTVRRDDHPTNAVPMPPTEGDLVSLLRQLTSVRPGLPCPTRWPATGGLPRGKVSA